MNPAIVVIVLAAGAMVLSLRCMGRPWWCACGKVDWWATGKDCYSQHFLDPWSVVHVGYGMFMYGALRAVLFTHPKAWSIAAVCVAAALFEVIENTDWAIRLFRRAGDKAYFGDSVSTPAVICWSARLEH